LTHQLANTQMLTVLDNCEHISEACAEPRVGTSSPGRPVGVRRQFHSLGILCLFAGEQLDFNTAARSPGGSSVGNLADVKSAVESVLLPMAPTAGVDIVLPEPRATGSAPTPTSGPAQLSEGKQDGQRSSS
jgi:hypothetical protein